MFGFEPGTSCIRSGSVDHLTTTFGAETGCKDRKWIEPAQYLTQWHALVLGILNLKFCYKTIIS
jgi:hypothetical protein